MQISQRRIRVCTRQNLPRFPKLEPYIFIMQKCWSFFFFFLLLKSYTTILSPQEVALVATALVKFKRQRTSLKRISFFNFIFCKHRKIVSIVPTFTNVETLLMRFTLNTNYSFQDRVYTLLKIFPLLKYFRDRKLWAVQTNHFAWVLEQNFVFIALLNTELVAFNLNDESLNKGMP